MRIPPKPPSIAHSISSINTTPSPVPPKLPAVPPGRDAPILPRVLVTGGCGFVGSELLDHLIERHPTTPITVIDLRPLPIRYYSVAQIDFYQADLNDRPRIRQILGITRPVIIFHVAGLIPTENVRDKTLYHRHNFEATKVLVEECIDVLVNAEGGSQIKAFIYTSSSDAVKGKRELAGIDERAPYPKVYLGEYAESKAAAERLILRENRPEFPTCCLRPHLIIGARSQVLPILHQTLLNNETTIQIGDNKNLYDIINCENLCHATLLTAYNFLTVPFPPDVLGPQNHNYDYVDQGHGDWEGNPISAAGHTFFINNMEPVYFWTWVRTVYTYLDAGPTGVLKLSKGAGLVLASLAEFYSSTLRGKEPGMTKNRVIECCYNRWYRGDKAGHVLGYWGGLMTDSKGYGLGGLGIWEGTRRSVQLYLEELKHSSSE
ncbi:hypothetical protein DFH27DRAFT_486353 [Peziza echinospora]|nr:hypothetical protein DFH27DRAFT_486353 [Peziza echinospora]